MLLALVWRRQVRLPAEMKPVQVALQVMSSPPVPTPVLVTLTLRRGI